jgi:hypothetical protein
MTISEAYEFGKQAYTKGLPWIPANDKELLEAIRDIRVGEGVPFFKAWSKGWNDAFNAVFWAQEAHWTTLPARPAQKITLKSVFGLERCCRLRNMVISKRSC